MTHFYVQLNGVFIEGQNACAAQGWAMFTFLNDAMFFTMRCFPILNDVIFRRCLKKNIDLDVFDDV